jgi:hypothetical protein
MRIVGILVATVLVLFLAVQQLKKDGPQSQQVSTAIEQGSVNVSSTNLDGAKSMLDLQKSSTGSYAGADLSGAGVVLVQADETSYCIETSAGTATQHLAGPGGAPAPGPC